MPKTRNLGLNISFLKSVEKRLKESRIPSAASEAEQLVRHFSGMSRLDFFTGQKTVTPRTRKFIQVALKTRLEGQPLSYILEEAEFFGLKFFVNQHTLIPRPETEILVEEGLKILDEIPRRSLKRPPRDDRDASEPIINVLDIGAGSGCIAISLTMHKTDCRMTALDVSSKALKMARKNVKFNGLGQKIKLIKSNLFGAFGRDKKSSFDLIISNPPYVQEEDFRILSREVLSEPRLALDGGPQGLLIIEAILDQAPYFLKSNGWLLMEIGDGQAETLAKKILKENRFLNLRFVKDLNGIERVLVAQKDSV